jgi:chromosome segregation ATPase
MGKIKTTLFMTGSFLVLALASQGFAQSAATAQKSGLIELEVLTRAEQRAEALRAKLFELQMQEIYLQSVLEDLDYRMSPEGIRRALAFVGSVRPMDEWRDALRARLENEKARANKLLEFLASSRERLEAEISRADEKLERLRQQLGLQ